AGYGCDKNDHCGQKGADEDGSHVGPPGPYLYLARPVKENRDTPLFSAAIIRTGPSDAWVRTQHQGVVRQRFVCQTQRVPDFVGQDRSSGIPSAAHRCWIEVDIAHVGGAKYQGIVLLIGTAAFAPRVEVNVGRLGGIAPA